MFSQCSSFVSLTHTQAWDFKYKELQGYWINLAEKFLQEHNLNYRNDNDQNNGCIHIMAKYARCSIWKKICPKTRLRMKNSLMDDKGNKVRRRDVFKRYDPKINIVVVDENVPIETNAPVIKSTNENVTVDTNAPIVESTNTKAVVVSTDKKSLEEYK